MEERISFTSGAYALEGLLHRSATPVGIVITHPHPLFGGNMHNSVVETLARTYFAAGATTLRFNFRGSGQSQGGYEEGRGEQTDVKAAVDRLHANGVEMVDVAGYSFGAWVAALAVVAGLKVRRLIMISPPLAFVDFTPIQSLPPLHLVVSGDKDEIAPVDAIGRALPVWQPRTHFEIIAGADHFYSGHLEALAERVRMHL